MDLHVVVPRSHSSSSGEYWSTFFTNSGTKPEWYGGYEQLAGILHKYIKPTDVSLIIDGKDSRLGEGLYDAGYQSILTVNTTETETVTKQMREKNSKARPKMKFLTVDVTQMSLEDTSMNAILDRGWLDSIMADAHADDSQRVQCFLAEISRVLITGGRYICITLAAVPTISYLLKYFTENGWMVRLHRVVTEHVVQEIGRTQLRLPPVFAVICTKLKKLPGIQMPLEVCLTGAMTPQRVESTDKILTVIEECRHFAMIRHELQSRTEADDDLSVELYSNSQSDSPRYTMHVVDSSQNHDTSKKYGIFIIPQGRETEWMFSTVKGRANLAKSAGYQRLLVVSLHRDHSYTDMDSIQAELSCKVMELSPQHMDESEQVPFLSIGDDIGHREVVLRGSSQLTGDFIVEDVSGDAGEVFRRLLFNSGTLIQSQARLTKKQPRKGRHKQKDKGCRSKVTIDYSYLDFSFHKDMVAGLATIPQFLQLLAKEMCMLLVGLGAGTLPMFLYRYFPKLHLDVVELDTKVAEVAKSCFGFTEDQRMKLFIADGLEYIRKLAEDTTHPIYHAIIFDVDAKNLSTGLNSPPRPFIEKPFLRKVDSLLHPEGIFMVNLVSRDDDIKQAVIDDMKTVFPMVFTKSTADDVNETLYAISRPSHVRAADHDTRERPPVCDQATSSLSTSEHVRNPAVGFLSRLTDRGKQLQTLAQSISKEQWDPDTDLSEILAELKLR